MKFIITSIATLIALVQAIEITNDPVNPVAGEPFEITWQNAEGPVTISLRYGDPNNLSDAGEIVANLEGEEGTYTWDVPTDLVSRENYALYVDDGVSDNYSVPFALEGDGEETETTTAAPTSTVTSTVESTSSSEASTTSESASSTSESASSSSEASSTESESASSTESESASQTSDDAEETDAPDSKAGRLGSPVALIFTLAAMLYFH